MPPQNQLREACCHLANMIEDIDDISFAYDSPIERCRLLSLLLLIIISEWCTVCDWCSSLSWLSTDCATTCCCSFMIRRIRTFSVFWRLHHNSLMEFLSRLSSPVSWPACSSPSSVVKTRQHFGLNPVILAKAISLFQCHSKHIFLLIYSWKNVITLSY